MVKGNFIDFFKELNPLLAGFLLKFFFKNNYSNHEFLRNSIACF